MTTLWAVADLHAAVRANMHVIDGIQPASPADWLIVAGDVAERRELILDILERLRARFAQVIWVPGNHELFCRSTDARCGKDKYEDLVTGCRLRDVLTPEDPYPTFGGVTIASLFTLYDYSFRDHSLDVDEAVAYAMKRKVMMTDEFAIAPFVDVRAWCWDRLAYSVKRLSKVEGSTILVNHWPLVIEPVKKLSHPEIGLWCGSRHTRSWASRYNARAVIYGHLHSPGTCVVEGVSHIEVSLGYPREWQKYDASWVWPYPVMVIDDE